MVERSPLDRAWERILATDKCGKFKACDECLKEIKKIDLLQDPTTLLTHEHIAKGQISNLIDCQDFSSYNKLLRVTAYVIKFVNILRNRIKKLKQRARDNSLTATELAEAENLWLRDIQVDVRSDPKVKLVKRTLKKILGQAFLSFEELLTVVTDIECTVNCRTITYLYSDGKIEPLTPSHLMSGRRVISSRVDRYVHFSGPIFVCEID